MNGEYPGEPSGPFPEPPRTITDAEGRETGIEVADADDETDLLAMYRVFDPADRAQGIPPAREPALERWLETVLAEECVNVLARHVDGDTAHDSDVVGHATLVPDDAGDYELAIFVIADYQGAGIGTALLETLLGHAAATGIERVWLTVERWNDPAIALYRSVGFETTDAERFEMEMAIRL